MFGKSGWGILLPKRELRCLLTVPESDSPDAVLIRQTKPLARNWSSAAGWRSLFHTVRVWLLKPFMGVSGVWILQPFGWSNTWCMSAVQEGHVRGGKRDETASLITETPFKADSEHLSLQH